MKYDEREERVWTCRHVDNRAGRRVTIVSIDLVNTLYVKDKIKMKYKKMRLCCQMKLPASDILASCS